MLGSGICQDFGTASVGSCGASFATGGDGGIKIGCVGICGLAFGGDPPGEGGGPGDGAIDCVDGSSGIGSCIEVSGAGIDSSRVGRGTCTGGGAGGCLGKVAGGEGLEGKISSSLSSKLGAGVQGIVLGDQMFISGLSGIGSGSSSVDVRVE